MIEICPKKMCTGCGVCTGVCPVNCIEMKGDDFGYIHPIIDSTRCIECNLCKKTCPNNRNIEFFEPVNVYAGWAKNNEERLTSISGGIAAALSRHVISQGGIVYGAVGEKGGIVRHHRASSLEEIKKFKKSKYVQSYISRDIFRDIKNDIKEGRKVLFTGTPCQTAAVRAMSPLNENLLCVEIICHGVPSQQIFQDHMQMITGRKCDSITNFSTRDNSGSVLTLKEGDKILYRLGDPNDPYMNAFRRGLFFRPSCYQCHYAKHERQADLTIGDFWGLGQTTYSHEKVSVILENTSTGTALLEALRNSLFLDKRSWEEAARINGQLKAPFSKPSNYNKFRRLYLEKGYSFAIKRSLSGYYRKLSLFKYCSKLPGFYRLGLNKMFKL